MNTLRVLLMIPVALFMNHRYTENLKTIYTKPGEADGHIAISVWSLVIIAGIALVFAIKADISKK